MKGFGRWVVLRIVGVLCVLSGFAVRHHARWIRGFLPAQSEAGADRPALFVKDGGFWHQRRDTAAGSLDELRALPYVVGSQAPAQVTGVTTYDAEKSAPGANLFSSAHSPRAFLVDATGKVLHEWRRTRDSVWPALAGIDEDKARQYFRRLHLLPNGDLLAIFEYTGIVKLDAQSNLLWAHQGWNHHHLDVDGEGKIYVLGRDFDEHGRQSLENAANPKEKRRVHGTWVYDEYITVLSPEGALLEQISLLDCIENSRYAPLLDVLGSSRSKDPVDLLHSNTLRILDGRHGERSTIFQAGNLLVSLRNISTIAILDPVKREVVWALQNAWRRQHDPVLLANGNLLLFDNHVLPVNTEDPARSSRVVEFDPFTQQVAWEFRGTKEHPLFSSLMGANQRLPNGNTLITESDFGRALEVTQGGEVVWEFTSPHTTGEQDEFVAVIPDVTRLPVEFPLEFIRQQPKGP